MSWATVHHTFLIHLNLVSLLLIPMQWVWFGFCFFKGESTFQKKYWKKFLIWKQKGKPAKGMKEQTEVGGETGKPILPITDSET